MSASEKSIEILRELTKKMKVPGWDDVIKSTTEYTKIFGLDPPKNQEGVFADRMNLWVTILVCALERSRSRSDLMENVVNITIPELYDEIDSLRAQLEDDSPPI